MAEGFARTYGDDCLIAASAGVAPANSIARDTRRAMAAKHIDMGEQFPKALQYLDRAQFDVIVNMTGSFLPSKFGEAKVLDWDVPDPITMEYDDHCAVRDAIERRVMTLILELRRPPQPKFRGQGSGRLPL
jgi:protein-tyrosine-phosphatase